ncbi:MAG: hypothetical protein GX610_15450 [Rhodococcus sp.]|nr:hypothetical protein [Rhodococcus sp. (in: high G+C Gram-positive bacteria)]
MTKKWVLAVLAAVAMTLSSCAYDTEDDGLESQGGHETSAAEPAAAGEMALGVAPTDLGDIIVDANGMTMYVFGDDDPRSGVSSCDASCLDTWEPVTALTETPEADGVEAEIGTIPAADDAYQVTVNGRPLYRYEQDKNPGDVHGQDVGSIWWVLDPAGNPIYETEG